MVHTLCCPVHIGNAVNIFNLNKKLFHRQMNLVENLVSHVTSGDTDLYYMSMNIPVICHRFPPELFYK